MGVGQVFGLRSWVSGFDRMFWGRWACPTRRPWAYRLRLHHGCQEQQLPCRLVHDGKEKRPVHDHLERWWRRWSSNLSSWYAAGNSAHESNAYRLRPVLIHFQTCLLNRILQSGSIQRHDWPESRDGFKGSLHPKLHQRCAHIEARLHLQPWQSYGSQSRFEIRLPILPVSRVPRLLKSLLA